MSLKQSIAISLFFGCSSLSAQNMVEFNKGWQCISISGTKDKGEKISNLSYIISGWVPATVPGTILTTLLNNNVIPDPFYGMNNKMIPDIYDKGRNYYTYWFVKDFSENHLSVGEQVWLHFRGVNYSCDVFLNGHKLNRQPHHGMYLRQTYNITPFVSKDGNNRLAVIVYPPDHVGNPNGGQGGDGTIGRDVTHQYVTGWDWIQPIHDRNTGIWDKVTLEKTNYINLKNPHVITLVPGKRIPDMPQAPAIIKASAEIENPTNEVITGSLQYVMEGDIVKEEISIQPLSTVEVHLPDYTLKNPKLWWPNGYGKQYLYDIQFRFVSSAGKMLDQENLQAGVREIRTQWNDHTRSRQTLVNGQKIFIKGGNWIISDAMLRFSPERYDAEIRFHRDMNLNLIRIWGGALTERPEFYDACDKYGLMVFQDLWLSGDCNGKWLDPMKKDDQWTRRNYPDDHRLFLNSVIDQVKMIRNHPSLAFWCGGNEITPAEDMLVTLQDSIFPSLDGTRYFFPYSNSDSMSYNFIGGNGDGPYTIQPVNSFWEHRTFPFNSEIGSVGIGDVESLKRFIPEKNMIIPPYPSGILDSVWEYHKYIGYDQYIEPYGKPKDVEDFATKAQLLNYNQYRALIEGFSAHMWDWYTGVIIWKTQNPWTALRGQMYDYYLDPNACLYGLHCGSEPVHIMYDPTDGMMTSVNQTFQSYHDVMLEVKAFDMKGKETTLGSLLVELSPTSVQKYFPVNDKLEKLRKEEGVFMVARLMDQKKQTISENLYWFPDSAENYKGLQQISPALVKVTARKVSDGKIEVGMSNPANGPVAFFNRISLVNEQTGKRILPSFYSDNYISIAPGEDKTVTIDYHSSDLSRKVMVSIKGWNVSEQMITIQYNR